MTDRSVTEAGAFSRGISKLSEEKKIKEKTKSKRTTQIVFFFNKIKLQMENPKKTQLKLMPKLTKTHVFDQMGHD